MQLGLFAVQFVALVVINEGQKNPSERGSENIKFVQDRCPQAASPGHEFRFYGTQPRRITMKNLQGTRETYRTKLTNSIHVTYILPYVTGSGMWTIDTQ